MSKRLFAKVILKCFVTVFFSTTSLFAGTMCQQTIELVGKTNEDTSKLCFYEYVSGECAGYKLYELTIVPESLLSAKHWLQDHLTLPIWGDSIKSKTELEIAERLSENDGNFGVYYKPLLLSNPRFVLEENKRTVDSLVKFGGPFPKKVENPDFHVEAELIYSMPGGLYLNYEIHEAYIFRKSRILFIVTYQPIQITAYDTLHGVLIYKIKENI